MFVKCVLYIYTNPKLLYLFVGCASREVRWTGAGAVVASGASVGQREAVSSGIALQASSNQTNTSQGQAPARKHTCIIEANTAPLGARPTGGVRVLPATAQPPK